DPPSIDAREITDKGSINQKAVLANRAALVEDIYAEPAPSIVISVYRPALAGRSPPAGRRTLRQITRHFKAIDDGGGNWHGPHRQTGDGADAGDCHAARRSDVAVERQLTRVPDRLAANLGDLNPRL